MRPGEASGAPSPRACMRSLRGSIVALHPLLVQFPLALWGMSFVFDVLSLRFGAAMTQAARFNLAGGLIAAVVAAAAGVHDFRRRLQPRSPARRLGRWHA